MTVLKRLAAFAACALVLALAVTEPALTKNRQPYNAETAARKYCGHAYKRYCSKVRGEGLQSLECLKKHVKRLPPACRKAVRAL